MRILVTGASGFVGKALLTKLSGCRYLVRALTKDKNIFESHSKLNHQVDWRLINIYSSQEITQIVNDIDVVIHLSARVHIIDEQSRDPLHDFLEVNLEGTLNLAKHAAKSGVKRFVYISSIKVNGEYTEDMPFDEGDLANPHDAYAISKWRAEQGLLKLSKDTGMEVVIIRPPLVYGPRVKANFLRLLNMVNQSIPLPLACINNQRSMIYVGNLVDAIITCAIHPKAANQTYLVSDSESLSTPQLIRNIAQVLGKQIFLLPFPIFMMKFLAHLVGETAVVDRLTQSLVVDSSKIHLDLDWTPPFTMKQGLELTAEWFKNQI